MIQVNEAAWLAARVEQARAERNRLLRASDWAALPDAPAGEAWLTYRQALRDVPQQAGFPDDVEWPVPPDA